VMAIARKLTKSDLAGMAAALLWVANPALATPMSWTSSYNEIQFATFILASFYLFLKYTETGNRKFYWAQFATFVLGFGALELNVVYPALAGLYAILFARRFLRSTVPLFAVSLVYVVLDRLVASGEGGYYYEMNWSVTSVLAMFARYWALLLGVPAFGRAHGWPRLSIVAAAGLLTAALLAFAIWEARQRRFLPVFLIGWYSIVLAPVLPLYHHLTDYYVMVPSIAMAILAAYGLSLAWHKNRIAGVGVAALLLVYAIPSILVAKNTVLFNFERADWARALVQSVAYAKRVHPDKTILLANVGEDLFWSTVADKPFLALGWHDVFLTPECKALIVQNPHGLPVDDYILPAVAVKEAVDEGAAEVYDVENRRLRNITRSYTLKVDSSPEPPLASDLDVGAPFFSRQIGPGWYRLEQGYRWCGRHASVYLRGPLASGEKLHVSGSMPEIQRAAGPLHLTLTVDGQSEPLKTIDGRTGEFDLTYDLPANAVGEGRMEVAFTLDRTLRVPTDDRDLGLVFGRFRVK